ncbi:MAG: NifB/NifX family molybdenum-iron cluster-binding protein [Candidatus Cloacimonadota bacterium]|nr:NifB/NifX family molybdenum-iron cluster-binding protein [Candidatus Cloacimonadota bacterium]
MKIAFTTTGKGWDAQVDRRFGRANGFFIFDEDSDKEKYISNKQNMNAMGGAGVQSAQNIINLKIDALVTGNMGPRAFQILNSAGIKIYLAEENLTIKEAYDAFRNNELKELADPNVSSHWT